MINYNDIYKNTKNFSVLYVEDDIRSRNELNDTFQDLFHRVDLASNGEEGLAKYRKYFRKTNSYYDLVITDLKMPKMNGITLSKAILQKNPKQELVVISGYADSHYLIELINIGVNKFLLKPFKSEKILELFSSISRQNKNSNKVIVTIDKNYAWSRESSQLLYDNAPLHLTRMEKTLMRLLVENGSKTTTNSEILMTLWQKEKRVSTNKNLAPLISQLRKKLPQNIIKTRYGIGYHLSIE